jgi:V8-like Glu-specific endopeptidase
VVDSSSRNIIVTAAHCISGTAEGVVFAPQYHDGTAPLGIWTVQSAYAEPAWLQGQDPRDDYVFLRVEPKVSGGRVVKIEDVAPGDRMVINRSLKEDVVVIAYPAGVDESPIRCANVSRADQGVARFDCNGYVGGTSGGPWIASFDPASGVGELYGVIGGLKQGGCSQATSYTSHFDAATTDLLERAVAGNSADVLPVAGSSGC